MYINYPGPLSTVLPAEGSVLSIGILAGDLANLHSLLENLSLQSSGPVLLHYDCMDGHFAPQLTIGAPTVSALKENSYGKNFIHDVHLMVQRPSQLIDDFARAGSDMITIHLETGHDEVDSSLQQLQLNYPHILSGLALCPQTPLAELLPYLSQVSIISLLAIDPTVTKKSLMPLPAFLARVAECKALVEKNWHRERAAGIVGSARRQLIVIDGGVTIENIKELGQAGADIIVSGSALFRPPGLVENLLTMRDACCMPIS